MPRAQTQQRGLLDSWGRRNRKHADRRCLHCGKMFRPKRASSHYCSRDCAWANNGKNQKTKPESWWVSNKGYITGRVWINGVKKPKRYHRWLVEKLLGVELTQHQVVHHINGDKMDNHLENLKVMGFGLHSCYHNKRRAIAKAEGGVK